MHLFQKDIYDWKSWSAVYQSLDDFRLLIEAIFEKEQFHGYDQISHLTPGTNAVFKAGKYVIKIFAPKESGANPDDDYNAELQSMGRALQSGIRAPRLIAASSVSDKYVFNYLIMEYIEGQAAGDALKEYTMEQKQMFIRKLNQHLYTMNRKPLEKVDEAFIKERAIHNSRWNRYSSSIRSQIMEIINQYEWSEYVYVHGDLTADNIIVDKHNEIYIIDFADSIIAPAEYEYPPIIFDLFDSDKELVHEFMQGRNDDDFIENLFMGTLLHDFGGDFVKKMVEQWSDKRAEELSDIYEFKKMIHDYLQYKQR
ncbi:phosphotransferase [Paenibacillus sp. RC67]|uniref:phosphotransferase family protein n=1 Tax=Paenibacillus sp. RC67 TaxID=3039392 RepID=UPI0024AE5EC1|nr:phosphotransferase [Paenibacillus sp. RC67]